MSKPIFRRLILLCFVVVALPALEMVRESVVYHKYSRGLQDAKARLRTGMNQAEVLSVLGSPDAITQNDDGLFWDWNAKSHQGILFKKFGLTMEKGHYGLLILFDDKGKVSGVWGAVD